MELNKAPTKNDYKYKDHFIIERKQIETFLDIDTGRFVNNLLWEPFTLYLSKKFNCRLVNTNKSSTGGRAVAIDFKHGINCGTWISLQFKRNEINEKGVFNVAMYTNQISCTCTESNM